MTIAIDLNTVITTVVGLVFSVILSSGVRRLNSIRDHLATLNGSVGTLKQWDLDHEKMDERNWRELTKRFESIEISMSERRDRVAGEIQRLADLLEKRRN